MKRAIKKTMAVLFAFMLLFGSVAAGGEEFSDLLDSLVVKVDASTSPSGINHNGYWGILI